MARRKMPDAAAILRWSPRPEREWSPAGTIRVHTESSRRYRVMHDPGVPELPYFALARHGGFWNDDHNWEIIDRQESLEDAKLMCGRHATERAGIESNEEQRRNGVGGSVQKAAQRLSPSSESLATDGTVPAIGAFDDRL